MKFAHMSHVWRKPDMTPADRFGQLWRELELADEVISFGFWPGDEGKSEPAFFAYAYPHPEGLEGASVGPGGWDASMEEFILPYEAVRRASDPAQTLLEFLQKSYDAVADLGPWPSASPDR